MAITVIRHTERPDLWADTARITEEVWPAYNRHGDVLGVHWHRLLGDFPAFQFVLYDDQDREILAEAHTVPCGWDGTDAGLGDGIDAMIASACADHDACRPVTALCAMAAEIRPRFRGRGLANQILDVMSELAREAGLAHLIAPVRPSFKDRYPITPIEQYITWTRENGEPFDPWIRMHTRRGGRIVRALPKSMRITGTIAEWELWTGMQFPGDGQYTFPAGLAPVEIDHASDRGSYWEPNVWIVHAFADAK